MKELINEFKHIARDVTIYLLPGLTFSVYCLCLYAYCNNDWKCIMLFEIKLIIILLFASYIFGHLIMGLMEVVFIIIPIENKIKKLKPFKDKTHKLFELEERFQDVELEILAFENKEKYEFFVERHTLLSLFRWNLAGVFLVTGFISIISTFLFGLPWYIFVIQLILSICTLLFSIQTEIDGKFRRFYLAQKNKQNE